MKHSRAVVLVLAAFVLFGCAPATSATTTPPSSTPSPTPIATQARETGLVAPARPFGGDCAAVMSTSEASAVLGEAAVADTQVEFFAPEVAAELHGGLYCRWVSADPSSSMIAFVVLPADAVSYDPASRCEVEGYDDRGPNCVIEAVVNGTRVSGRLTKFNVQALEPLDAALATFMALFDEKANASTPAPVPIPALGAWAHPVDCQAVVATGDVSAVSGLGAAAVGMRFPFGGHRYAFLAEDALENGDATFPYCWIDGEAADVTFVALGGGRWLESTVAATGTPFVIDGYESAYATPGQEGLTKVDIFHGPNWLHFQIRHTSNAKALADALFAGLNATAAS